MRVHPFPTRMSAGPIRSLGLAAAGWHLRAAVNALRAGAREALRRRRTRQHLAELDGHLLRDIGVTTSDAHLGANKPFWMP